MTESLSPADVRTNVPFVCVSPYTYDHFGELTDENGDDIDVDDAPRCYEDLPFGLAD